ncbi:MAG: DegT/DnrJ/EryC1/StrS family aminotransferase [Desulfobacterales bacterium]|nr:DegT/DnrJ/EryC1/StrS family aminotransferase [Desulfobacterales bacterium]MBF0396198.1 DegT/DnrJ/EryC1/StrS family aminotransferase [Desulfobacterales bacterium]
MEINTVQLLDLKKQYKTIKEEVLKVTEEIYESQQFILGQKVEAFEKDIASYCDSQYGIGVSSGTDALLLSLMAADVSHGDYVITTSYSFFATAGSIARLSAKPIFVDICLDTFNISPESIENAINSLSSEERKKVKAIIPVHLYGQSADMDAIIDISRKYNMIVIEDAAQAIGSEYKGKKIGSIGDFGCFSFFPSKNLGAFGDAGLITTNKKELYEKLKILRVHGSNPKYYHKVIGGNFRIDALQAAIIHIKLKYLDEWTKKRQNNADKYRELLKELGDKIKLPIEKESRHTYNQFVILVKERDELKNFLTKHGIGTEIYYPVPLHLQECFSYLNYKQGDLPVSEYAALHSLALPIYPELSEEEITYVAQKIKESKLC